MRKALIVLNGVSTLLDAVSLELRGNNSRSHELDSIRCSIEDLIDDLGEDYLQQLEDKYENL